MKRSAVLFLLALCACDKESAPAPASSTSTAPATSTATAGLSAVSGQPSATASTSTAQLSAVSGQPSASASSPSPSASPSSSSSASSDSGAPEYARYTNARYGFSIDYPTIMTKNPASANDAGQSFSWKSKASMRAWGFANSAHLSAKSLYEDWARRNGVTTKDLDAVGWTVAGSDRGKSYYSRCIYGDQVVVCVEIQYDADVKETIEPMAKHIAESLTAKK